MAETCRKVADHDQLRPRWPKLAEPMDTGEHDVPAYMTFPGQHRKKPHNTNPIACLNEEVKRHAEDVGIVPNEAAIAPSSARYSSNRTTSGRPPADTCESKTLPKSIERKQTSFSASKPSDHDLGSSGKLHHIDGRDRFALIFLPTAQSSTMVHSLLADWVSHPNRQVSAFVPTPPLRLVRVF